MKSDSATLKGELEKLLLLSVGVFIVFVTLFAVQNFRINIPQAANQKNIPVITTGSLPYGFLGLPYSASVSATDVNSDQLNMTISGLPAGLARGQCSAPVAGGKVECTISGTPAFVGNYFVTVSVTDRKIPVSKELRLSIYAPPVPSVIPER